MPTYSYQCENCSYEYDVFQKISDEALVDCPQCGKPSLMRGFGGGMATFHFKGSGFYINDYKNSSCSSKTDEKSASDSSCPCGKKENKCNN